ncbi:hypothetical protein EVG20_g3705 [Dentipellis fragilis]|uniref:Uncharacterized protein n=1 Tax=Dentipellis fragilis TaxID=205917 RepID=A0A4Y9Z0J4_9AGAM|nr:hypothetical protein EVG20_g3705 [Dentipellis fragilis]
MAVSVPVKSFMLCALPRFRRPSLSLAFRRCKVREVLQLSHECVYIFVAILSQEEVQKLILSTLQGNLQDHFVPSEDNVLAYGDSDECRVFFPTLKHLSLQFIDLNARFVHDRCFYTYLHQLLVDRIHAGHAVQGLRVEFCDIESLGVEYLQSADPEPVWDGSTSGNSDILYAEMTDEEEVEADGPHVFDTGGSDEEP